MRVGLISDTHGALRPSVFDALDGVDRILHAGDVGRSDILVELETIAPVDAVCGNTDGDDLRARLGLELELELQGRVVVLTHGHAMGAPNPLNLHKACPDADIVVYGHTHIAAIDRYEDTLFVNPGAAGPGRLGGRPSLALLDLGDGGEDVLLVELT
ncbi:MAG: metallophosphoesterase family protein [Gemmatimonadota bacterium]